MIKFCSCGEKETIQPYQDCRWLKGLCSKCRRKRIVASVTTQTTVTISRKEALSFLSKVKLR